MIYDKDDIKYSVNQRVHSAGGARLTSLIWAIVVVLFVLWLLGFSMNIGGSLIFLLLVLAVVGVIYNLLAGGMYGGTHHHHHTTEVTEVDREV
jgi:amino acid transporter